MILLVGSIEKFDEKTTKSRRELFFKIIYWEQSELSRNWDWTWESFEEFSVACVHHIDSKDTFENEA